MSQSEKMNNEPSQAEPMSTVGCVPNDAGKEQDRQDASESQGEKALNDVPATTGAAAMQKGFQFWAIMTALCITGLLGALENTVVSTSLPAIVNDLAIGENYVWITNVFFLTSAAVQPLFGQLANIFGRRWLTMFIVAIFMLGSGICGGAVNGAMLIVGRAIQGIGSGGINMIVDVVVSDLVPLRERGKYISIVLLVYLVGTALGPFAGGAIVDSTTWRWVFYLNLPVGGLALVLLFFFLHVRSKKELTLIQKAKRIDYLGNSVLMAASVAVLYALTYGGSKYQWSDVRILVPLVLGLLGMPLFMFIEGSGWMPEPVVPLRLFSHRTGSIVAFNTFMNSALLYWAVFYLPIYFQAVRQSSASRSGVQMLPLILVAVPGAIISVVVLSRFGRYKALHVCGFAIVTIGLGLFSILDQDSSAAEWIIFQMFAAAGSGMVLNTLLPSFQAGAAESDQAAATASWAFIRSFGNVWGVAIPAAIFNNRFGQISSRIRDPSVVAQLSGGHAYELATQSFISNLPEPVRSQTIDVFSDSLKRIWEISIVFSGVACLLALVEKEIPLRTELETEYGIEQKSDGATKDAATDFKGGAAV